MLLAEYHAPMEAIRLEACELSGKEYLTPQLFLEVVITETEIQVGLGPGTKRLASNLWSQNVYELQNLALGLTYVAKGELPEGFRVPTRDLLIGPITMLWPALRFELGHPGIGKPLRSTTLYCSRKELRAKRQVWIDVDAINENGAAQARCEVKDVLRFAEELYSAARAVGQCIGLTGEPK